MYLQRNLGKMMIVRKIVTFFFKVNMHYSSLQQTDWGLFTISHRVGWMLNWTNLQIILLRDEKNESQIST